MNKIYINVLYRLPSTINLIAVSIGAVMLCDGFLDILIELSGIQFFPYFKSSLMLVIILLYLFSFDFLTNSKKSKLVISFIFLIVLFFIALKHESYFWGSIFILLYISVFMRNLSIKKGQW